MIDLDDAKLGAVVQGTGLPVFGLYGARELGAAGRLIDEEDAAAKPDRLGELL